MRTVSASTSSAAISLTKAAAVTDSPHQLSPMSPKMNTSPDLAPSALARALISYQLLMGCLLFLAGSARDGRLVIRARDWLFRLLRGGRRLFEGGVEVDVVGRSERAVVLDLGQHLFEVEALLGEHAAVAGEPQRERLFLGLHVVFRIDPVPAPPGE